MSTTNKRQANRTSWKPGTSGNPNGRPRSGAAFSEAVRARLDPDAVLDLVVAHLADESVPAERRLATILPYVHAGFARPATDLNVTTNTAAAELEQWDRVPLEERRRLLAEAGRALSGACPDGATDDNRPEQGAPCHVRATPDTDPEPNT